MKIKAKRNIAAARELTETKERGTASQSVIQKQQMFGQSINQITPSRVVDLRLKEQIRGYSQRPSAQTERNEAAESLQLELLASEMKGTVVERPTPRVFDTTVDKNNSTNLD